MRELNTYIEHTLLKQDADKKSLKKLFDEAKEHKFLGVCVNPCNVKYAAENLKDSGVKIVTVVGFPLGASRGEVKAYEAKLAIEDGADEIDMVLNVGLMKDKDYEAVQKDIETVKKACELCVAAKADLVKTSTGFVKNGIGATAEDVKLMYDTVSPYGLEVKASAGIRDKQKAIDVINAGATRLGTSSGVEIVK